MIARYTRPDMRELLKDESRFAVWLEVELAHLETLEQFGVAPKGTHDAVAARATVSIPRIEALERDLNHDVVAFLTAAAEPLGEEKRWLHFGLTSSDLVDTAQAVLLKRAGAPILQTLRAIGQRLRALAVEHRGTLMVGRTHGVHAEPTTFGFKLLGWYQELGRQHARIARAFEQIGTGKLSGSVGTSVHLPPEFEEATLARLGLAVEPAATQVVPRDRHAELLGALASLGGSLERFATEIRHLQRTEVREAEEPFGRGQKGSSSMPHKRNPILAERICGLSRLLRTNAMAGFENMALWHERDISHSSVERVVLVDSLLLADYLLDRFRFILDGLQVYPERMRANLESSGGLVFSQRVLLALTERLPSREEAYRVVQEQAMATWNAGGSFEARLAQEPTIREHFSAEELHALFDATFYLRHLDRLFERSLRERWEEAGA